MHNTEIQQVSKLSISCQHKRVHLSSDWVLELRDIGLLLFASPLLACLAYKWFQIGTAVLLLITSTDDELLTNVNIDDLE